MAGFPRGFRTQSREIEVGALPLQGSVPDWLSGSLVRVTPAQFEVGEQRYRRWFDGLAMLHSFAFDGGRVSYANRYLRTPAYRDNNAEGAIRYSEFATDSCRSLFTAWRVRSPRSIRTTVSAATQAAPISSSSAAGAGTCCTGCPAEATRSGWRR